MFFIVGSIIGLAGIWAGYIIAKKSGSFRKIIFDIKVHNISLLEKNKQTYIVYGFDKNENDRVLCQLPISIVNNGDKTAYDVIIRFRFNLILKDLGRLNRKDIESKYMRLDGPYDLNDIKRTSFTKNGFYYVDYILPEIRPTSKFHLNELIDISIASGMSVSDDVVSKEGVPIKLESKIDWKSIVQILVSADETKPITATITIESFMAKNIDELVNKIEYKHNILYRMDNDISCHDPNLNKNTIFESFSKYLKSNIISILPALMKLSIPEINNTNESSIYFEDKSNSKVYLVGPKLLKKEKKIKTVVKCLNANNSYN